MAIQRGARVRVQTADGQQITRRALGGVVRGHDFNIVLVCDEKEWKEALAESREPEGVPWPAEDVEPLEEARA